MLHRHDERRLSPTRPPPSSEALARAFESLLARIHAVREQCEAQLLVGEGQVLVEERIDAAEPAPDPDEAGVPEAARTRRVALYAAGAALLLAAALVVAVKLAWAEGGVGRDFRPVAPDLQPSVFGGDFAPRVFIVPERVVTPREQKVARAAAPLEVCVRLCDGYFFPNSSTGGEDACAAQCPDAPTALYTERPGSKRITDFVSTNGNSYSALPTAFRYRAAFDNTCTCHHSPATGFTAASLSDPTLRKGDAVMTPKGLLVFRGGKSRASTSQNFVAASQATAVPKALRAALLAAERGVPQANGKAASPTGAVAESAGN